jgi:hypothetical protein
MLFICLTITGRVTKAAGDTGGTNRVGPSDPQKVDTIPTMILKAEGVLKQDGTKAPETVKPEEPDNAKLNPLDHKPSA